MMCCCGCSITKSCLTLCDPMDCSTQAPLSSTISRSLLKLVSVESGTPSNHLILCRPLLLLSSIFPSIRVFSNESAPCIRWPEYWSFSFSISPYSEYSGLISFRIDWFDLLAVRGTLKSSLAPWYDVIFAKYIHLYYQYLQGIYKVWTQDILLFLHRLKMFLTMLCLPACFQTTWTPLCWQEWLLKGTEQQASKSYRVDRAVTGDFFPSSFLFYVFQSYPGISV